MVELIREDALQFLRSIPDKSVNLVLTDPPYNIGKTEWDFIPNYIEWCKEWILECERILTDTGSMYIWHNDMPQIANLMKAVQQNTSFHFRQFNVWVKKNFRGNGWKNPGTGNKLRNWFNICEYCLYYVKADAGQSETGLERINSNPECYKPLKQWYAEEKERIGLTDKDIAAAYTMATGKKPYMLRHYFKDNQFEMPTEKVWNAVYKPLGFANEYSELRKSYEELRKSYEELRKSYEELRPVHKLDKLHCNVWESTQFTGSESVGKNHICEKPVDLLERIIRTSSREGDTVVDPFMGSGSTAVACIGTGRNFLGCDNDLLCVMKARERVELKRSLLPMACGLI